MPAMLLRGLDDALHAELRERARRNHRSVNAELLVIVEAALAAARRPLELTPEPAARTAC